MQAGLGGGSSDAATLLLLAASGALGNLPPFDLPGVARSLGSDVPFFLAECAALVEGTGERVTPLGNAPPWWAVVVGPPAAVSTSQAYAAIDAREREIRPRNVSRSLAAGSALQRGDFDAVETLLWNDFDPVAVEREPAIARAFEALRAAGARAPLLAGSGCVRVRAGKGAAARRNGRRAIGLTGRLPSNRYVAANVATLAAIAALHAVVLAGGPADEVSRLQDVPNKPS